MVLEKGTAAEAEEGASPEEKGRAPALKIAVYVQIVDLFSLAGAHCPVFKQGVLDAVHPRHGNFHLENNSPGITYG